MVIKNSFLSDNGCVRMSVEESCAGIFKQSMGARNRVGIGLSYRPARLEKLYWNWKLKYENKAIFYKETFTKTKDD